MAVLSIAGHLIQRHPEVSTSCYLCLANVAANRVAWLMKYRGEAAWRSQRMATMRGVLMKAAAEEENPAKMQWRMAMAGWRENNG